MDIIEEAKRVFDIEIKALQETRDVVDDIFVKILDLIVSCNGKVIVTGMGKPGHIAKKMAATFSSLGTPSFFLHPGEAMHGDLGMISKEDVVIAISYSGESDEIIGIIPNIKLIGATLVAISSNKESTLVKYADIAQILPNLEEACYLGLAPTSSTTCELCYGDALAVVASRIYGFDDMDFGKRHPAGSLGKKLILKVDDLMATEQDIAVVNESSSLMEAVVEMAEKGLGIVIVTDNSDTLLGVITDGDLRRQLSNKADIYSMSVKSVMSTSPKTVEKGMLAIQALNLMKGKKVSALPVLDEGKKVVGVIKLSHIVEAGIVV